MAFNRIIPRGVKYSPTKHNCVFNKRWSKESKYYEKDSLMFLTIRQLVKSLSIFMHGFFFPEQKSLISLLIDKYLEKKVENGELCITKYLLSFKKQVVKYLPNCGYVSKAAHFSFS